MCDGLLLPSQHIFTRNMLHYRPSPTAVAKAANLDQCLTFHLLVVSWISTVSSWRMKSMTLSHFLFILPRVLIYFFLVWEREVFSQVSM